MPRKIIQLALVGLGLLILVSEAYISYAIVDACLAGKGESGCIGVSGLEYVLIFPVDLLLLILYVIYLIKYHQSGFISGSLKFILLLVVLILISIVPMSMVRKVQSATLFGGTAFGINFTNYSPWEHQNAISTINDCDAYIDYGQTCKIDYIVREDLGLEACDLVPGEDSFRCRYEVMKKAEFIGVTPEMCMERLYAPKHAYHYILKDCVTAVAKRLKDPTACEVLRGIAGAQKEDKPDVMSPTGEVTLHLNPTNYYGRCLDNFSNPDARP